MLIGRSMCVSTLRVDAAGLYFSCCCCRWMTLSRWHINLSLSTYCTYLFAIKSSLFSLLCQQRWIRRLCSRWSCMSPTYYLSSRGSTYYTERDRFFNEKNLLSTVDLRADLFFQKNFHFNDVIQKDLVSINRINNLERGQHFDTTQQR